MEPLTNNAQPAQLQDRTLSTTVSLVALCPKMDLLALVLDGNTVSIFRTSWHRLANISVCASPEHVITCLAWSPTGANLVVATTSGALFIHSVDRAASVPIARARRSNRESEPVAQLSLSTPATSLLWTPTPPSPAHYEDRSAALYANPVDNIGEKGLLFVGDRDGTLSVFTSDLKFTVAQTKPIPHNFYIDTVFLTHTLRDCAIIGYPSDLLDQNNSNTSEATSSTCVVRRGCFDPISDFWSELERVAVEVVALKSLATKFDEAEALIRESWVAGALEVVLSSIVTPLRKLISDFGEEGSAWEALHDVFCGARVKGALLQFLGTDLSENGAKEVLRLFRAHVTDIRQGISSLVPLAENTLIRASEYRGLTRLKSRFSPVGSIFQDAENLYNAVEKLFFLLEDFTSEIERISLMTEAFLAWLVLAASKAGGESIQGQTSSSVESLSSRETELVFSFFDMLNYSSRNDDDSLRENFVGSKFTVDVLPALHEFRKACEVVISRPSDTISRKLEFTSGIEIPMKLCKGIGMRKCFIQEAFIKEQTPKMYIFLTTLAGRLVCVSHELSSSSWAISHRCPPVHSQLIHDIAMFSEREVMVAMTNTTSADESDEQKVSCELAMYELDYAQMWEESLQTRADTNFITFALHEPMRLSQDTSSVSSAGLIPNNSHLRLSVNPESGIVSLLVEPRRLLLYEVHREKPNPIDASP